MPVILVVLGLALIAVALAFKVVAMLLHLAAPLGLVLIIIGVIWLLAHPSKRT